MKVQAMILSDADITTKTAERDGKSVITGKINLLVTEPTQTIEVGLSEEQIKAGFHTDLKKLVGFKPFECCIEYRNSTWGDEGGKHRSYNGFRLADLPAACTKQ
ncbi:hypothetical protein [Aeromonas sp. R9-1]|uniref:hypothetical protein n=1 Tax=Aeromonas sp. R9-1 TaxID=3138478 RepID=UPI0034A38C81